MTWPRRSTLLGTAAALLWAFSIAYPVFAYWDGDPRVLLRLGSMWEHPSALQDVPFDGRTGYDGQFYAALATDPLLLRPAAERLFDAPAYRASRAGLPLVAWVLGAGDDHRAIVAYQLLCWILGGLLVWVSARWLEDRGAAPWSAGLLALTAGVVSSMYSSLPDGAAATLMVLGLWMHWRGDFRASLAATTWACLVKETTLIAAAAIAWAEWRQGRRLRAAMAIGLPAGLVGAWRIWVLSRFGLANARVTGDNFGWPFAWVPEKLAAGLDLQEAIAVVGLAAVLLAVLTVAPAVRDDPASVALVGFGLLSVLLNHFVYGVSWWNYTRVVLPLPVLLVLAAPRGARWSRWARYLAVFPWAVVGGMMLPRIALGCGAALVGAAAWDTHRRSRRPSST